MKKIYILCVGLVLAQQSFADFKTIEGEWYAYSRASEAIYGKLLISGDSLVWGVSSNNSQSDNEIVFPCKAKIVYSFDQSSNLHEIKLENKICDFENMANSHISKKLGSWKVEIVKESTRRLEAKFYDFSESGSEMGNGVFHKYFPR